MREFQGGFWTVTRISGVPLRLHWSMPLALFVLAASRVGPTTWAGWIAIILVHEWAHLLAARSLGARVLTIDLWALGGLCSFQGELSPIERSLVALAGPGINLALGAVGIAVLAVGGASLGSWNGVLSTAAGANIGIGLFNLFPVPPLDGREALALPARWLRARAAARDMRRVSASLRARPSHLRAVGGDRDVR